MKYKIIIYGNNLYKEIKLGKEFQKGLLIGTSRECQMRFFRENFFTDFIIRILPQGEQWVATCEDSVYLKKDNEFKEYIQYLQPQDVIRVCYDKTDTELFTIECSIDFGDEIADYDRRIFLENIEEVTIGGAGSSITILEDEILGNDKIRLVRNQEGFMAYMDQARYGIMLNGFQSRNRIEQIHNMDIFSLNGYSFYLKEDILYTSRKHLLSTGLRTEVILNQKNHLEYPKFVRSARQQFEIPGDELSILPPKTKPQEPNKNLVMTMVPILTSMLMMTMMRMMMGSNRRFAVMCVGMAVVSIVMAVINYRNEGVQYRKNLIKRENDYNRYLAEQEEKIQKIREKERIISLQKYPSMEEHLQYVENFDARIFEKLKEHEDYLTVRLGEGVVESSNQIAFKEQEYREVDDPFMDYPEKMHDKYRYIDHMPVMLEMKDRNAIGLIGDRKHLFEMAKNLLLHISIEHYYQDIKIFLLMKEEDKELFQWARWMKTTGEEERGIRNFLYDEESSKVILEYLYAELSRREGEKQVEELPHYIVFVYRSDMLGGHPVSQYINDAKKLGFTFLFFEEYVERINQYCEKRIFLYPKENAGYIQDIKDGEDIQQFQYPTVPTDRAAAVALKMGCVYVEEVSLEAGLTKNITLYELLHIMNAYDLEIEKRWSSSRIYESMAAPLGVKSGDEIVYLDLHEKYHGPHGLVAGTTGSGKSEILQTYVLSMATLFHPYEVGFIIIDFKGGGMANQFRDLPHMNGAITNIDDGEIERSLSSIKAELQKRQRLFAEYDVNFIDDYIRLFQQGVAKTPLPHLILIVDEFAELKSEQPEFMKELISAARIGRSLGVHLILATQKPAGVVNDQIWSNSKFKLCLKVQNQADSKEVLKSPLAAEIREPGRAYLQVGNNEIFQLFQSAYSGAAIPNVVMEEQKKYRISKVDLCGRREVIFEQKPKSDENNISQLDAIVDYIHEYCEQKHIERLPNICLPALAEIIPYGSYLYQKDTTDIVVPIGLYDDPSRQEQKVTDVNFTQGHILIVGSSQSGKTNLIQVLLRGIAEMYTPDEVNVYLLDFGSMILKNFEKLNHVGGVITSDEDEKLKNFYKMILEEITNRKIKLSQLGLSSFSAYLESGKKDMPQIVVMVDNMTALRELYSSQDADLLKIMREGAAMGICVVATIQQSLNFGYKLMSNFSKKIALYCNESGEYSSIFEKCKRKLKEMPGRCIVSLNKNCYEGQIYLAFHAEKEIEKVNEIRKLVSGSNKVNAGKRAKLIPSIPDILTTEIIDNMLQGIHKPYRVPIGVNFANMELDEINFAQFTTLGISGNMSSRRVELIHYIISSLLSNQKNAPVHIHIIDDERRLLGEFEERVTSYSVDAGSIIDTISRMHDIVSERNSYVEAASNQVLDKEPLECLIVNSVDAYDIAGNDEVTMLKTGRILSKFGNLKISIILSDVQNTGLVEQAKPFVKILKPDVNILTFHQIKEYKLSIVPLSVQRMYAKPLSDGDAYFIHNQQVDKIRVPEYEHAKESHN